MTAKSAPVDAASLVEEACARIERNPLDMSTLGQELYDLKTAIVSACAAGMAPVPADEQARIAGLLPDFHIESCYQKRATLLSLGVAVFLGWVIGGLLSAFLNLLGMGGDILRVLAIFCILCLNEYLSATPRARRILLSALGLGALGRFSAMIASGALRLANIGSWRGIIFGASKGPNIFKYLWLMGGAFFVFAFFSKKISALDAGALKAALTAQTEKDMQLARFILTQAQELALMREESGNERHLGAHGCPRGDCPLALGVTSILPALDANQRAVLSQLLESMGYSPPTQDTLFVWQDERDSPLYETIGLIRDGDLCRELRPPVIRDNQVIARGAAQKAPAGGSRQ